MPPFCPALSWQSAAGRCGCGSGVAGGLKSIECHGHQLSAWKQMAAPAESSGMGFASTVWGSFARANRQHALGVPKEEGRNGNGVSPWVKLPAPRKLHVPSWVPAPFFVNSFPCATASMVGSQKFTPCHDCTAPSGASGHRLFAISLGRDLCFGHGRGESIHHPAGTGGWGRATSCMAPQGKAWAKQLCYCYGPGCCGRFPGQALCLIRKASSKPYPYPGDACLHTWLPKGKSIPALPGSPL